MHERTDIFSDMAGVRTALRRHQVDHRHLLRLDIARPAVDVAFDMAVALLATAGFLRWGTWVLPWPCC